MIIYENHMDAFIALIVISLSYLYATYIFNCYFIYYIYTLRLQRVLLQGLRDRAGHGATSSTSRKDTTAKESSFQNTVAMEPTTAEAGGFAGTEKVGEVRSVRTNDL